MARHIESSISYFPLMVDLYEDRKILKAEYEVHVKGGDSMAVFHVVVKLMCWIYGKEGYWIQWDETSHIIFAQNLLHNIGYADTVNQVVEALLNSGFFDRDKFEKYQILTSHGIQVQWKKIIVHAKRKATINPDFDLINSVIAAQTSEEMTAIPELIPQSKVNKSKVNKSKVILTYLPDEAEKKETGGNERDGPPRPIFEPMPSILENMPAKELKAQYTIQECSMYVMQHPDYRPKLYLMAVANELYYENGPDKLPDLDALYAWARSFNRFLIKTDRRVKSISNYLTHFGNWLKDQNFELNPDDLNEIKHEKTNNKTEKFLGNSIRKTEEFRGGDVEVKKYQAFPDQGDPDTPGKV